MKRVLLFLVLAIVFSLNLTGQTLQETTIKEDGGFEWIITESFDGKEFKRGAKSTQGKELIPCEYDIIYYRKPLFLCSPRERRFKPESIILGCWIMHHPYHRTGQRTDGNDT